MTDALTPGATARLLGVSPTTLRSWDRRYGIGPRERSPGGHRRYSPADVARLRELCRLVGEGMPPLDAAHQVLTQKNPTGFFAPRPDTRPTSTTLPPTQLSPTVQGVARAAMRMDSELVERVLQEAIAEHGTVATWENLAMPLLHGVGRTWEDTRRYVEVEHLLSWSVSSALRRVPWPESRPEGQRRPVLLACAPHERHSLPVEALAAALREVGLAHLVLGACTPPEATAHTVERLGPRAVVLWCHTSGGHDVDTLVRTVRTTSTAEKHTALYTAGPGWRGNDGVFRLTAGHLGSLPEAMTVLGG